MGNEYFTNPYNFVPLDKKCERSAISIGKENHYTGYFSCTLELLTSLFIPNTSWDQALCGGEERKKQEQDKDRQIGYEFFSYEDLLQRKNELEGEYTRAPLNPVIPGSEIRGAVRSVYEAAFNGCMPVISGKIEKVKKADLKKPFKGTLKKDKNTWIIVSPVEKNGRICVSDDEFNCFKKYLQRYYISQYGRNNTDVDWHPDRLGRKPVEVKYYKYEERPLFISPASIREDIYAKELELLLSQNGGYQPCGSADKLCSACKVFGMVSKEEKGKAAIGSRVRFTDALLPEPLKEEDLKTFYGEPVILPVTGTPNPDTVEFYTISPYDKKQEKQLTEKGYWSYRYVTVKNNQRVEHNMLPPDLPKIRGRKFYWHSDNWSQKLKEREEKKEEKKHNSAMQIRIRPISAQTAGCDKAFHFRIYFERLTEEELSRLKWSIDFDDEDCAHKIGHGKPFGLGSVKIHIDEMITVQSIPETGKMKTIQTDYHNLCDVITSQNKNVIAALKIMTNWKKRPKDVSYPKIEDRSQKNAVGTGTDHESRAYEWFQANRKGKDFNEKPMSFCKVLPSPEEEISGDVAKKLPIWSIQPDGTR